MLQFLFGEFKEYTLPMGSQELITSGLFLIGMDVRNIVKYF